MALKHRFEAIGDTDVQSQAFDFSRLLGAETISSATWTARNTAGNTTTGISIGTPSNASGVSTATVTGSDPGEYLIECQVTGSGGSKWTARAYQRVLEDGERY